MTAIRPPAVAGAFYPGEPGVLRQSVADLLDAALRQDGLRARDIAPKAIIAPHAGYVYSGACAARAHALFRPEREAITRIVLLGPAHRVAVRGLATTTAETWETPAGPVPIDRAAVASLADLPQVSVSDEAHALEHSLEVHLPFLQALLPRFSLVPFAVGSASAEEVAAVLERLWGGPETRIVISSDLSHFLGDDAARALDDKTARTIEAFDGGGLGRDQACGRVPVAGLLGLAAARGLAVQRVGLCNSGDTAGSKDRVVGYGAWAFSAFDDARIAQDQGEALLEGAGAAIRHHLEPGGPPPPVDLAGLPQALRYNRATFVTLMLDGKLRGCRGSLRGHRALAEDVAANAVASGFDDRRFPPLTPAELPGLGWSISLLTPPVPLAVASEDDLLAQLRPGEDGLILRDGDRQSTFLPQVWEALPRPQDFLARLREKAGLSATHWSPSLRVWRYRATKIG